MAQKWNSEEYANDASFVSALGMPVVDLLAPQAGEKILDLGCGDGTLALKIASLGCDVVGVDFSESMVLSAQEKGITALCQSGECLSFSEEFDAVFSNAALHWMTDYDAVLKGVHSSLKPGGRFIGEFGGAGNIAAIRKGIEAAFANTPELGEYRSPWFFPCANEYQSILEKHGFVVDAIDLIERPTPLATGIIDWLNVFAEHATSSMSVDEKHNFLAQVEQLVKPSLYTEKGGWVADYVRLRFSARKRS